jgi:hypothetical protein
MNEQIALVNRTYDQMAWNVLSLIHLDCGKFGPAEDRLGTGGGGPPPQGLEFMAYVDEEDNNADILTAVAQQDAEFLPYE